MSDEDDAPAEDAPTEIMPPSGTMPPPSGTPASTDEAATEVLPTPVAQVVQPPAVTAVTQGGSNLARWAIIGVLGLLLLVAIGAAALFAKQRSDAREEASAAKSRLADASDDARSAKDDVEELTGRVGDLEDDLQQATEDAADAASSDDAPSEDSNSPDAAPADGDGNGSEDVFTTEDESILLEKTRESVKVAAGETYASCGVYTLVGSTLDGRWAITHADLASNCGSNATDPGEFLWQWNDSGFWEQAEAGSDSMVICGAHTSASGDAAKAINDICAAQF